MLTKSKVTWVWAVAAVVCGVKARIGFWVGAVVFSTAEAHGTVGVGVAVPSSLPTGVARGAAAIVTNTHCRTYISILEKSFPSSVLRHNFNHGHFLHDREVGSKKFSQRTTQTMCRY
jgi:hypothetical protein